MSWSNDFIGLPFRDLGRGRAGADCWGLVVVHRQARGLPVTSYAADYDGIADRQTIGRLIRTAQASGDWMRVDRPQEDDLVVFLRVGIDSHVGTIVDRGRMLHVDRHGPSRVERFDVTPWTDRSPSFWRWNGETAR